MSDLESMSFAVIARTVVGMIRTAVFSLAIMCFDWRIGLVFFVGMLLFLWVNSRLLKKSRELSPGRLAAQTKLVDAVLEYIQGMSVVLSLIHIFLRNMRMCTPRTATWWAGLPFPAPGSITPL